MTLLTTMLDFSDTGEIGLLVTEEGVATREAAIGERRPAARAASWRRCSPSLRANDLIWPYVVKGYLQGQGAAGVRPAVLEQRRHQPARARCSAGTCATPTWRTSCASPAATVQCGEPVDLAQIDVPTFLYASQEDHIVPWKTAYASTQLLWRRVDLRARRERPHRRRDQPAGEEQAQLLDRRGGRRTPTPTPGSTRAENVPGSWWPAWNEWLAPHAGKKVNARKNSGNAEFTAPSSPPPAATCAKRPSERPALGRCPACRHRRRGSTPGGSARSINYLSTCINTALRRHCQ